jgi:hypothetical protein
MVITTRAAGTRATSTGATTTAAAMTAMSNGVSASAASETSTSWCTPASASSASYRSSSRTNAGDADISLELSDWTTRGGRAGPVQTGSLGPEKFTLQACGTQKLTLVVNVRDDAVRPATKEGEQERARLHDVDDCEVLTADLRLVGCDHRPVRLAVAVVPRDCDPSRIHCGCTCC